MAPRTFLFLAGTSLLGLTAIACNGKTEPVDDTSGSTSLESKRGEADEANKQANRGANQHDPTQVAPPSPGCTPDGVSSSSGGTATTFSCESRHDYACSTGPETLSCSCSSTNGVWGQGSCSCNGLTFAFDCATGCSPGAEEYAKCNLPAPAPSTGGGGSSTSSTSSSSGG